MKRFIFLLILLTGFVFEARLQAQSTIVDEVIWIVGDDAIFLSDVENMRMEYEMERHRLSGDPYCFIPEQIAIQKLFLHQAKLDSIEVQDSDVYSYVENKLNGYINAIGSVDRLEEYFNKKLNAIREEMRVQAKEHYTIDKVQRELVKKVKVTPSDVRSFYKKIPEDSLPFIPTTVEVEIITIEPKVSLEEIDDIKNRLREFTELVNKGERQFSYLARAYSDDKATAVNGGRMGFVGRATLVPDFAAAAFELNDPRRVSRIVQTEYGYHIIQLHEKRGDRIDCSHILLKENISKEAINVAIQRLDSIRADIRDSKYTFEEATYFSFDKDTKNNKGLMVNNPNSLSQNYTARSGTSRFEMEELPPEIAKMVVTMQIGNISEPFSMINVKTNKEIAVIIRLKSRIEGHKASLTEDYQALRTMVEEEKQGEVLNKWIAKKQKETYIRINDNWKNCDFERDGWVQK